MSMLYWFFNNEVIVSELKDASLSQYIVFMFGKKFISCNMGLRTSIMALESNGCTKPNFENLSKQVKKKLLICRVYVYMQHFASIWGGWCVTQLLLLGVPVVLPLGTCRFRPYKVYIFLIRITSRVDLAT